MATIEERKRKITDLIEQINSRLDGYVSDVDKLIEFHKFRSQMNDKYSVRNCALIEAQFPGAIKVAGYSVWKEEGYHVKKGQKSLSIIAPSQWKMVTTLDGKDVIPLFRADEGVKKQIEENQLKLDTRTSYRAVPVFDIHQTNCSIEDYPDYIQQFYLMGQTERFDELYSAIENFRENQGVGRWLDRPDVQQNTAKGFYVPSQHSIWVDSTLNQKQFIKTNLHELAHASMHRESHLSSGLVEYQAELTAAVVANYFGLGTTAVSTAYINTHIMGLEIKDKEKLIEEVLEVSNQMIDSMELHLENEFGLSKNMGKEVNDIIALAENEDISNEIPNSIIDYLDRDNDNDGAIDRYDSDDRDSKVQTFGEVDAREKTKHSHPKEKMSLNKKIDQLIEKKNLKEVHVKKRNEAFRS